MTAPDKFLHGVNSKDAATWKELYRFFYGALCNYSASIGRDAAVAEDIVQDCLVTVWRSGVSFDNIRILSAYLYRSVYNNTLKYLRDKNVDDTRRLRWADAQEDADDETFYMAVEEDMVRKLREALAQLPEQRRKVLMLSIEGLTVQQIADRLGVSPNTVKTQKKRAYAFLKEVLRDHYLLMFLLGLLR